MVRLSPRALRQAFKENPLLPILLRSCRDLSSARNELRWLHESVKESPTRSKDRKVYSDSDADRLRKLCIQRGKGVPLQYILGTQPFGDLDIKCKRDVLIPRPETEAWTTHLAESIVRSSTTERAVCLDVSFDRSKPLSILDLCTGSGCITLLLHALLSSQFPYLQLLGVDASQPAVGLAFSNLHSSAKAKTLHPRAVNQVRFIRSDIFKDDVVAYSQRDILVANPPYISPQGFDRDTSVSVRRYEPRRALVPPDDVLDAGQSERATTKDQSIGDAFYPRLLDIAHKISAKLAVLEVADMKQAKRVVALVLARNPCAECEIWRDWPSWTPSKHETVQLGGNLVRVVGEGNGRAVAIKTNQKD